MGYAISLVTVVRFFNSKTLLFVNKNKTAETLYSFTILIFTINKQDLSCSHDSGCDQKRISRMDFECLSRVFSEHASKYGLGRVEGGNVVKFQVAM